MLVVVEAGRREKRRRRRGWRFFSRSSDARMALAGELRVKKRSRILRRAAAGMELVAEIESNSFDSIGMSNADSV